MKDPIHPMKLQRELRLHLVDLQLADDPHAELIANVYARLVELENYMSKVTLVAVKHGYTDLAGRAAHPAGGDRA